MNRCIRNRTYGGVRVRELRGSLLRDSLRHPNHPWLGAFHFGDFYKRFSSGSYPCQKPAVAKLFLKSAGKTPANAPCRTVKRARSSAVNGVRHIGHVSNPCLNKSSPHLHVHDVYPQHVHQNASHVIHLGEHPRDSSNIFLY